ncbi:MAG: hypothetical protein HYZ81_20215 [Nitrospinae bacterium]|nr:hypothetical protein [Nitrospinota bacterium]
MRTEGIRKLVLVSPVNEATAAHFIFAPRLPDLHRRRVGLLDNSKSNAGQLLQKVAKLLSEQYRFADIVSRRKPSASKPAAPEMIDELSRMCDLVIVGVGD